MNELMIHIERIVRPVRAMQFRKLRMRRELLAHLQTAFDEERAGGIEEAAALEAAKRRLGDPAELTRSLQKSVPWLERTLMARVRGATAVERFERNVGRAIGLDYHVTLAHSAIITMGGSALLYMALLCTVLVVSPKEMLAAMLNRPAAGLTIGAVTGVGTIALFVALLGFMFHVARSGRLRERWLRIVIILAMPTVVMTTTVAAAAHRAPAPTEWMRSVIIGVALLLSALSLAQVVARRRRPYDPWLTLNITE
jgi:hypothetical protein